MKKLVLVTAIVFGGVVSQADIPLVPSQKSEKILRSVLENKVLDTDQFNNDSIDGGVVEISRTQKLVTLRLNRSSNCQAGEVCAAVMPLPRILELPLKSVKKGVCGTRIYTASKDSRPVDGILQVITVHDNSAFASHCKSIAPVDGVEVSYRTAGFSRKTGIQFDRTSTFKGDRLVTALTAQ